MRYLLVLFAALCAGPACAEEAERALPTMTATVTPLGEGKFEAALTFGERAPLWIFHRSAVTQDDKADWRAQSWELLTPDVELRRIGNHQALVPTGGRGMPNEVRIRVTPYAGNLLADYTPALVFTDGTTAIFSDHFTMRPAPSLEAVAALGASFNSLPDYEGGNPRVVFRSGEAEMRHHGKRRKRAKLDEPGYVVFGTAEPIVTDEISTLIDPGLPDWLRQQLSAEVTGLLDLYAQKLGPHGGERPELIVAWRGPSPGLVSLGGSVMGNTIIMQIEGDRLVEPSSQAFGYARQFIAHEAAHFWLGNAVTYGDPGEAWTSEGGADLMAQRAAEAIDPTHDSRPVIERSINTCAEMADDGPLETAPERNGQQVYYACGLVFSLVAEHHAKARGGDFFSFWRGLIDAERDDGTASVQDWLEALRREGASDSQVRLIAALHENGVDDTRAALITLLSSIGIEVVADQGGRLRLA